MKTSNRFWKVLSVVIMVLAIGGLAAPTPSASVAASLSPATPSQIPGMCQVASPNPGEMNTLTAVTSVPVPLSQGQTMMWAVGSTRPTLGVPGQINTLVMLNKGNGVWGTIASPSYPGANYLTGVSGTSAHDVWAVGYYTRYGNEYPLVMHYDGIVWKFALYPDPSMMSKAMPGIGGTRLMGVTALSAKEVVAVGYRTTDYHGFKPYVLYYNGTAWKEMYFPSPEGSIRLLGVAGKSMSDLWAIATQGYDNVPGTLSMLYRFYGGTWNLTTKLEGNLYSLAVTPERVYAVGHADLAGKEEGLAVAHDKLKGESMRVKTFNKDVDNNYLYSVVASGDNVYAAGYSGHLDSGKPVTPLVLKYDGAMFQPVSVPAPSAMSRLLGAVMDHGSLWAVGDYAEKSYPGALLDKSNTLIESTFCLSDH